MAQNKGNWFVRKNGHVTGPFSSAVIYNHLIVGRLKMDDEISVDEKNWAPLKTVHELKPGLEKVELERAKRMLDERKGQERRDLNTPFAEHLTQRKGERRTKENDNEVGRRALRLVLMEKYLDRRQKMFWPMVVTFVSLFFITLLAIYYPTTLPVPMPNCSTEAGPGINWNNCLKPRQVLNDKDLSAAQLRNSQLIESQMMNIDLTNADLAYSDLRYSNLSYSHLQGAKLIGTDLRHTDLSYADLGGADLSFANLHNANLGQAALTGTRFDKAIWIDGSTCDVDSIGQCKQSNKARK